MSMRLGSVPAIVVSSPQAAELFLKTHDLLFASRPMLQASLYMSYGNKGVAFSEYGPYWRSVRKLCTLQLLSASKIEYFAPMRREEVGLLVDSLKKAAAAREVVDISLAVGDLIQNMTCRMVFGEAKNSEFDLKPLAKEVLNLAGAFNIADYVPFLGAFDLQVFCYLLLHSHGNFLLCFLLSFFFFLLILILFILFRVFFFRNFI